MSKQEKDIKNDLPKGWKIEPFKKFAVLKHGYQFRNYDFVDKGIPVVKIGQCKSNGTLT
jgi:type I restriction enzyme S subunit